VKFHNFQCHGEGFVPNREIEIVSQLTQWAKSPKKHL